MAGKKKGEEQADEFVLDLSELTLGDLRKIEKIAKQPAGALFKDGGYTADAVIAAVYVSKRKSDPSFTLKDAENVKLASITGAVEDPT